MDDYAIVINAGSSSLKFSIYRRPDGSAWNLDTRGQVDGIGTSPRLTAKDGSDARVADDLLAQGLDGRGAFDAPRLVAPRAMAATRACSALATAVHGGASTHRPTIVTTEVLTDLRALVRWRPSSTA